LLLLLRAQRHLDFLLTTRLAHAKFPLPYQGASIGCLDLKPNYKRLDSSRMPLLVSSPTLHSPRRHAYMIISSGSSRGSQLLRAHDHLFRPRLRPSAITRIGSAKFPSVFVSPDTAKLVTWYDRRPGLRVHNQQQSASEPSTVSFTPRPITDSQNPTARIASLLRPATSITSEAIGL